MGKGIVKLGEGNWAVKDGNLLAAKETNGRFKNAEFTVTRGTDATYVGRDGLIVNETGNDTPRIDFTDNTDGHLLLEPESRNLYLNSEPTVDEGIAANITYESFAWDNGFTNCVRFADNLSTTYRYGGTALANTTYTLSCYVIMDDLSKPVVSYGSLFGDNTNNSNFDFSFIIGGVINPVLEEEIKYEDCGNNIWKVSRKGLVGTSSLSNNGIIKYTGQSSKGFRAVGWQLEPLSYATSYIPTNGSQVTRDAETCTGAGEAIDFNSEEGILYAEIAALANDGNARYLGLNDGSSNNRVVILYYVAANAIRAIVEASDVKVLDEYYIVTDVTDFHKVAVKYKANDFALWVDGEERETSSSGSAPIGLNKLDFTLSTNNFYGKCKAIRVYKETNGIDLGTLTSL